MGDDSVTRRRAPRWSRSCAALVGAASCVALVATGSLSATTNSERISTSTEPPVATVPDHQPLTIDGEALPTLRGGLDPAVGLPAPVLTGADYVGRLVTIGGPAAEPTLVIIVAHWCFHCDVALAEYVTREQADGVPDDLRVVLVSAAVVASEVNYPPGTWLKRAGWRGEILADDGDRVLLTYGLYGYSGYVLIDSDGTLLWRGGGNFGDAIAAVDEFVS